MPERTGQPGPQVDYSLARKAVLRAYHAGRVSRFDICDAHPDLLRAARFSGEQTDQLCPVCEQGRLILVSYLFSDELRKEQQGMVWKRGDLAPLMRFAQARLYTVEVCPGCSWNHVRSQLWVGHGGKGGQRTARGRGRRATT